ARLPCPLRPNAGSAVRPLEVTSKSGGDGREASIFFAPRVPFFVHLWSTPIEALVYRNLKSSRKIGGVPRLLPRGDFPLFLRLCPSNSPEKWPLAMIAGHHPLTGRISAPVSPRKWARITDRPQESRRKTGCPRGIIPITIPQTRATTSCRSGV